MTSASLNELVTLSPGTKTAFERYLLENPNNRRLSQADKETIIGWLTDPHQRPSSQKESSRRNYVRKTFVWEEETQSLLAIAKTDQDKDRMVVTEDMIVDVVESVHKENNHAGWDATWKAVSTSYYGVLRSDLIFLLKRCQTCAQNPSKRPKSSLAVPLDAQFVEQDILEFPDSGDMQYFHSAWYALEDEEQPGH